MVLINFPILIKSICAALVSYDIIFQPSSFIKCYTRNGHKESCLFLSISGAHISTFYIILAQAHIFQISTSTFLSSKFSLRTLSSWTSHFHAQHLKFPSDHIPPFFVNSHSPWTSSLGLLWPPGPTLLYRHHPDSTFQHTAQCMQ